MDINKILDELLSGHSRRLILLPQTEKKALEYRREFIEKVGPRKEEAIEKLTRFLDGAPLSDIKRAWLIANVFNANIPDRELGRLIDAPVLVAKFLNWLKQIISGGRRPLVWFRLLGAYLDLDVKNESAEVLNSRNQLRDFLMRTFSSVQSQFQNYEPRWVSLVQGHINIFSDQPTAEYAADWVSGRNERFAELVQELGIASDSWLVVDTFKSCVQTVIKYEDQRFKSLLNRTVELLNRHKLLADEALISILKRYSNCADRSKSQILLDLAIDLWGHPRLRHEPSNRWFLVPKKAHLLVMNWLNEDNLRLFFKLLETRDSRADIHGRKNFWLRYVNQMISTRLILGPDTRNFLERRNDLKSKISDSDYYLAELRPHSRQTDAFIMFFKDFFVVDFHPSGGGYIYDTGTQTFDLDENVFSDSTSPGGLKEHYRIDGRPDIVHSDGWQDVVERRLAREFSVSPNS